MQIRPLRLASGVLLFAFLFVAAYGGSSPPKSTLWVYLQTTQQGAFGTQILPIKLSNPPKDIMVRAQPEVSERDIAFFETKESDAGLAMKITFTDHGRDILNNDTIQNQGKILVVILNGRVIYAPVIDKVIADGVLIIPRGVAPDEVAPLQEAVKKARKL